jgi:predicted dinucleotide-binding enzyme
MNDIQIALIGYGEVGQTIASDLRLRGIKAIRAFDILFSDSSSNPLLTANERNDVLVCHTLSTALSRADVIISAVTAAECSAAAHAAAARFTTFSVLVRS